MYPKKPDEQKRAEEGGEILYLINFCKENFKNFKNP